MASNHEEQSLELEEFCWQQLWQLERQL